MASKMNAGFMAMMKKKEGAKPAKKMAAGMTMKKMAMGGYAGGGGTSMPMKDGKPSFVGDGKGMMNKGGMAMKKMASGGMTSMGKVKTGSGRDGVAERGKTKGMMVKMNKGGRAC